jgi:hypothetical protein
MYSCGAHRRYDRVRIGVVHLATRKSRLSWMSSQVLRARSEENAKVATLLVQKNKYGCLSLVMCV